MLRIVLPLAGVLTLAGASHAQIIAGTPGSLGGGFPPFAGARAPAMLNMPRAGGPMRGGNIARASANFNRPAAGYSPMYPYYSRNYGGGFIGSGFGGGFGGYGGGFGGNRFYNSLFFWPWGGSGWAGYDYGPQYVPYQQQPAGPPEHFVPLSGELTATLALQFPAPARIWLDGKEVEGEAAETRTLTSPVVKPGQQYTFKVRAQWTAGGRTYEATREIAVGPGDRSKLLIVSGTAIDEK